MLRLRFVASMATLAGLAAISAADGPTGLWFLTDGDSATDALIQGNSVNTYGQAPGTVLQYPIQYDPVSDLFETVGRDQNQLGGVYTPNHTQVGSFGNFSSSDGQHLDGTLDITHNRTLASNFNYGQILRYTDGDFNSPTTVQYDTTDFDVWSVAWSSNDVTYVGRNGFIELINDGGGVLGGFATPDGPVRSLAWDASDNTLWYLSIDGSTAVQFSTNGQMLDRFAVNLGGNYWGGEIKPVPEPATMAALGLGTIALIRRRRRK